MTTDTERLDEAEEIYLTEDEFDEWFDPGNPHPEILIVEGTPLMLKDRAVYDDFNHSDPFHRSELRVLVDKIMGRPDPVPPPEPEVRKLICPADAVWTLFCCNTRVIAVNKDGSVAVHYITDSPKDWRMWIAPTGVLSRRGREETLQGLAWIGLKNTIGKIQSDLKDWVKCEHGRRMPRGISRLLKHIAEARKIYPPPTKAEIEAKFGSLDDLLSEAQAIVMEGRSKREKCP